MNGQNDIDEDFTLFNKDIYVIFVQEKGQFHIKLSIIYAMTDTTLPNELLLLTELKKSTKLVPYTLK